MRPYVVVHVMQSVDGRIDCEMTEQLDPTDAYYDALAQLGCPSQIMGRVTMQMHYAAEKPFVAHDVTPIGRSGWHKAVEAEGYVVALDTHGRLTWASDRCDGKPLVVVTSEACAREYHETLKRQGISWIAVGREGVDLAAALEVLCGVFGVERLACTGGGHLNGSLVRAGLVDEVSVMVGPGIDGRRGMTTSFDGADECERAVVPLVLRSVERMGEDVWVRWERR